MTELKEELVNDIRDELRYSRTELTAAIDYINNQTKPPQFITGTILNKTLKRIDGLIQIIHDNLP
jgi:hypothetical protein